jgi:4-hydroxy-tetrahydrodipicolinate synthase
MFCDCNPIPVKTAMNMAGLDAGERRLPRVELTGAKRKFVYDTLIQSGYDSKL